MPFRFLIVLTIAFLVVIIPIRATSHVNIDSLKQLLNEKALADSQKYDVIWTILSNTADVDIILKYSQEAVVLAEKLHKSPASATIFIGVGYLNSGKLSSALEYFLKAAEYYRKDHNNTGLATAYLYISEAYNTQENHNNAKIYLKNAINIFKEEKDSIHLASAMHNLGYAYFSMGEYDTSLIIYENTSEIYKKLNLKSEYAYCIGNSGLAFAKKRDYTKAGKYLLNAIELLKGDDFAVTEFMIEYASVLQHTGRLKEGIHFARESYKNASRNKITEMQRDAAFRLASLYMDFQQFDSACHYQGVYINLDDSIKNYKDIQRMADLRTEFEVAQKQVEVDILNKNRIIQRIVIISLIVVLILAGGLILLYYTNLKRQRRLTSIMEERRILLEKQSTELKELNRIKDKIFSVISHDLRGPISSIGGISHIIKESLSNDNPALLNEIAEYVDQTVFSLTGLLENLLNWAQSQQGKLPYSEEIIAIKEEIDEIVRLFSTVALIKNINLELKIKEDLRLLADRNSFMMIIRNLLSNALKFTPAGGIIGITGQKKNNRIEIIIKDNGIGISSEKLQGIFEFRENKSTFGTNRERGMGLGLILVHEMVKMNKGDIEMSSIIGKGTTVRLIFPQGSI